MSADNPGRLHRTSPPPAIRIVHLGLGGFFRAHQAWYTAHAPDGHDWGIAAFSGRSTELAQTLDAQQGLYTLVTRDADGDRFEVVDSVVHAHAGTDHATWLGYLADPDVAIVTLTVTEAAYRVGRDGGLDVSDPDIARDISALRDREQPQPYGQATPEPRSVAGRVVDGLEARREAGAGPLAVVSCDNLTHNGQVAARAVLDLAREVDPGLAEWIEGNVSFVTTMVDRITPRPTDDDLRTVREETGVDDGAPVVTEPFSEWVLSGDFPAGRPRWEDAGAVFTDDVAPFEERKLWLLNGAHSLLAYAGSARGHETVADAVADPTCRAWVEQWWDVASPYLTRPAEEVTAYRAALLERFGNPRIRHLLAQIAADGSQKVPVRILPALRRELDAGRVPEGATRVLAAWIAHLRGVGAPVSDPRADELTAEASGELAGAVRSVLAVLDPDLAEDDRVVEVVVRQVQELTGD